MTSRSRPAGQDYTPLIVDASLEMLEPTESPDVGDEESTLVVRTDLGSGGSQPDIWNTSRSLREIPALSARNAFRGAWFGNQRPFGGVFAVASTRQLLAYDIASGEIVACVDCGARIGALGRATAASASDNVFCIGDERGWLRMYRVDSGQRNPPVAWEQQVFERSEECCGVAFSVDGKFVAAVSVNGLVKVLDVSQEAEVKSLELGDSISPSCASVQFSREHLLVGSSPSKKLALWSVQNFDAVTLPPMPPLSDEAADQAFRCLASCYNGQQIAAGTDQGRVHIFDLEKNSVRLLCKNSSRYRADGRISGAATASRVVALAYSGDFGDCDCRYRDRLRLAVASMGGTVDVYDMAGSMACLCSFETTGQYNYGYCLAFCPDNSVLATGGGEGSVVLRELQPHLLTACLALPERLYSRSHPHTLHRTRSLVNFQPDPEKDQSRELLASCANERFVVLVTSSDLLVYERETMKTFDHRHGINSKNCSVALRPAGDQLALKTRQPGEVRILSLPSMKVTAQIDFDGEQCYGVQFGGHESGRMYLLAYGGFGAHIYDADTLTSDVVPMYTCGDGGRQSAYGACLSPDGTSVATAGKLNGEVGVTVRKCETGEVTMTLPAGCSPYINWICFDSDGRRLAYCFCNEKYDRLEHVTVADVVSGDMQTCERPAWDAHPVCFSPCGTWLICRGAGNTANTEGKIVLLDTKTCQPQQDVDQLFAPMFLDQQYVAKFTVGLIPSRLGSPTLDGACSFHVGAGPKLYIVDLHRVLWAMEDGAFETRQLQALEKSERDPESKIQAISRMVDRFPHARNVQDPDNGSTILHSYAAHDGDSKFLKEWIGPRKGTQFLPIADEKGHTALSEAIVNRMRIVVLFLFGRLVNECTVRYSELLAKELELLAKHMPELVPWALQECEHVALHTLHEGYTSRRRQSLNAGCWSRSQKRSQFPGVGVPGASAEHPDTFASDDLKFASNSLDDDYTRFRVLSSGGSDCDTEVVHAAHRVLMLAGMTDQGNGSLFHTLISCQTDIGVYGTKVMQVAIKYKWHDYAEKLDRKNIRNKLAALVTSAVCYVTATIQRRCRVINTGGPEGASLSGPELQQRPEDTQVDCAPTLNTTLGASTITVVHIAIVFLALIHVCFLYIEKTECHTQGFTRYFNTQNCADFLGSVFTFIACMAYFRDDNEDDINVKRIFRFPAAASTAILFSGVGLCFEMQTSGYVGTFITALQLVLRETTDFFVFFFMCTVGQAVYFMINVPHDSSYQMDRFLGDVDGTRGVDTVLLSAMRMGVNGELTGISSHSAWDTSIVGGFFIIVFNVIMMNILVAILTDKWQEVATSKELYALKSMADVIVTEDHKMTAAGPTTKKRFIHVVEQVDDTDATSVSTTAEAIVAGDDIKLKEEVSELRQHIEDLDTRTSSSIEQLEHNVSQVAKDINSVKKLLAGHSLQVQNQ